MFCFTAACKSNSKPTDTASVYVSSYNNSHMSSVTEVSSEEDISSVTADEGTSSVQSSALPESEKQSAAVSKASSQKQQSSVASKPAAVKVPSGEIIKAVWLSFLEYDEILKGKTEKEFTETVTEYFKTAKSYGLNTVIAQVRSHGDAYYKSKYFPASVHFTAARQDAFPFDPLSVMVKAAHENGLRIEAWVNPYRCNAVNDVFSENDIVKKMLTDGTAFAYGEYYYLNPASSATKTLCLNGIMEIVNNYNVDGIHFDDYFYPVRDDVTFFDEKEYREKGNGRTLKQFRTDNVNELVSAVYANIKKRKNITFGISPAGNIKNCENKGADVRTWGSKNGYVDYLAPQLYWDYGQGSQPYEKALDNWKNVVTAPNVKLIVGLAPYRIYEESDKDGTFWKSGNVLARQVSDAKKFDRYGGFMMFRYKHFFDERLAAERENLKKVMGS